MTLEDLRVFVAVCEARSLSAVARRLRRTQQAVSHHVRQLERELQVELFSRVGRGVELTVAGRSVYDAVSAALGLIGDAVASIEDTHSEENRPLALASGGPILRHYLGMALRRLRGRRPDLRIHLEFGNTTALCLDALRQRRADLAFVVIPAEAIGLETRPVLEMPLMLVVSRSDSLARRKRLTTRELRAIRYLSLPETTATATLIRSGLAAVGEELAPSMTVGDLDTAVLCAELAMGQAIVPAAHAHLAEQAGRIRAIRVDGLPQVGFGWVARRFSVLPRTAHEFMEIFAGTTSRWKRVPGLRVL